MSDKAVPFFNPADVLGLYVDANGNRWIQQTNGIKDSNQRAQGLGATGDEVANKLHGGISRGAVVYECFDETGYLVLPLVGEVKGGYHIDSFQVEYQPTGWARLTVNVHQHDDNVHADTEMEEFATTVKFPAQFGIPRTLTDAATGLVTIFENGDTDSGMRSLSYTLGCTHLDEDENGDHLAGENRDGVETLQLGFTKEPDTTTIGTGWDTMEDGPDKSNTAAETASLNLEHHVAREA